MDNMNKTIVGLMVLTIVFMGFLAFRPVNVKVEIPEIKTGAVSTYNATPEINLGGLRLVGLKKSLATATSTVCAIQSPAATSTLVSAGVEFTLASSSAVVFEFSKNTTQYATSTRIGSLYGIAASAKATIVASSTGSVAGDATIFAPNTWLVGKYYDANNGAGNASTGQCYAVFGVTS